MIDPDRAAWEAAIIAQYGECGARHLATVKAWPEGAKK